MAPGWKKAHPTYQKAFTIRSKKGRRQVEKTAAVAPEGGEESQARAAKGHQKEGSKRETRKNDLVGSSVNATGRKEKR